MKLLRFLLLSLYCFSSPLWGAVIAGGDLGHTTPPSNDPGWNRVGKIGNVGTGIYLGNGWLLTANHVMNASSTTFQVQNDYTYTILAGSENSIQLRNPADTANVDLRLLRVTVPENTGLYGLPVLPLISSTPDTDTVGLHIGTGYGQTSNTLTTWYVDTTDEQNLIWNTSDTEPYTAFAHGYLWDTNSSSRLTRWNLQPVNTVGEIVGSTDTFTTLFEALDSYGMSVNHDSGSPFFIDHNGENQLAGIAIRIGTFNNQPANTSVFGNTVYYADLSIYADQITPIVIPEPATLILASLLAALALLTPRTSRR